MKQSIAVCGNGFVGGSLTTVMTERGLTVYVYDKTGKCAEGGRNKPTTIDDIDIPFKSVIDLVEFCEQQEGFSGVFFVAVPTPMNETGECNTSIVENVLTELSSVPGNRIAVVKSTVPPGSTEKWNEMFKETGLCVVHSPEFLREISALDDMRNQDRIILGGPRPQVDVVRDVFRAAFPTVPIHKTSSTNSEMIKYVTNTFLTTKVLFANEIYQICEKLQELGENVDYDRVIELATLDKRLGTSHWQVPGPMPANNASGKLLRGVSGSCFVKDINALISHAKKIGVDPKVLEAVWAKNVAVRPERDWEELIGRAISKKI